MISDYTFEDRMTSGIALVANSILYNRPEFKVKIKLDKSSNGYGEVYIYQSKRRSIYPPYATVHVGKGILFNSRDCVDKREILYTKECELALNCSLKILGGLENAQVFVEYSKPEDGKNILGEIDRFTNEFKAIKISRSKKVDRNVNLIKWAQRVADIMPTNPIFSTL